MYKYGKIIALFSTIAWLAFIFSAFRGFHFWYAGFVFFFWLTLASLNYGRDTSLWLVFNKSRAFFLFYGQIFILSFFIDFVIGQRLTNFWIYPWYGTTWDWLRLYFIAYPFAGLVILELIYFLSGVFGEHFKLINKVHGDFRKFIDWLDIVLVYLIYIVILSSPLLLMYDVSRGYRAFIFWFALFWSIVATIKLSYHISHWAHWFWIFVTTFLLVVFLYEIPNVGTFEWKYQNLPSFLGQEFLGVPIGVVLGWYFIVLGVFRLWIYFVLDKEQK